MGLSWKEGECVKNLKLFDMYRGLRREMYILFYGRIVTNMGALIWPMLTLILTVKIGMTAAQAAMFSLIVGVVQLPFSLLGGKLADRFNKRNLIIVCDLVTVACYIACSLMEIGMTAIVVFCVGGVFATLEWPCYDALVADLTTSDDRERAYSLSYLGSNLGLVLAPTLGGLLFEKHLNLAFLITGLSTLSSTVLIFFFVKDITRVREETKGGYEKDAKDGESALSVLFSRPVLLLFLACSALAAFVYSQFNFLMPINMSKVFGARGAVLFGTMTSLNCALVVAGTPLITKWFSRLKETDKIVTGEVLIVAALAMFIFIGKATALYYAAMFVFTVGEIFVTLGKQPYLTRRIPATHRGRVASISSIFVYGFERISQLLVGRLADAWPLALVWTFVVGVGVGCVALHVQLRKTDHRAYPMLYSDAPEAKTE